MYRTQPRVATKVDMRGFTSNSLAAELEGWNTVLAQVPATYDVSVGRLL